MENAVGLLKDYLALCFAKFYFRSTICGSMATNPSSVKLRKLELKITRNDDDVIRFRREIFLEELKGIKLVNHCSFAIAIMFSHNKLNSNFNTNFRFNHDWRRSS